LALFLESPYKSIRFEGQRVTYASAAFDVYSNKSVQNSSACMAYPLHMLQCLSLSESSIFVFSMSRYLDMRSSKVNINIGMIMTNVNSRAGGKLKMQFLDLIKSILKRTGSGVHFVLLTDTGKCSYSDVFSGIPKNIVSSNKS
jgi:hypothetical protein